MNKEQEMKRMIQQKRIRDSGANEGADLLNRTETILLIRAWQRESKRRGELDYSANMKFRLTSGTEQVYLDGMVEEVIHRIRECSEWDPITEIMMYHYEMQARHDAAAPNRRLVMRYAGFMADMSASLIRYLKDSEEDLKWA